jgi:type I restriction enzyme S subunit
VEWLGQVPAGWECGPVKREFAVQLGKMLQNEPASARDVEVPYFKAAHVQWQSVSTDDLPSMWASPLELARYSVQSGDLLVCEGGEGGRCGAAGAVPAQVIIQNAVHRVRAKGAAVARFLEYLMRTASSQGWFDVLNNRATIAHFTREKLAALRIPLPHAAEQRAIADFLDHETARLDALVAKKERLIELLQEKRTALITHAVTKGLDPHAPTMPCRVEWVGETPRVWTVEPLGARYDVTLGKMLDEKRISGEQLAPYVRNQDVQWGAVRVDDLPEMDFDARDRAKYRLRPGDLLVCEGGEVGRTAIWQEQLPECYYQKAVHRLRPTGSLDEPRFLLYTMRAAAHCGVFEGDANLSTIGHLTAVKLRKHRFPFPPLPEQRAIADFLDRETARIDALIGKVREAIGLLKEYRAALISAAVTGKINVRGEAA